MTNEKGKNTNYQPVKWTIKEVLSELEMAGSKQIKMIYIRHGAREPLYGVTSKNLKLILKKTGKSYSLAMELYATGNYDAMYFAGMIMEPEKMDRKDIENWMKTAYCQAIADYTVALTLARTSFGKDIADEWIHHSNCLYRSAAWCCYSHMLGSYQDTFFDVQKVKDMLNMIHSSIHQEENRVRYAMNNFVIAVGLSYLPLHEEAYEVAKCIGEVCVDMGNTNCKTPNAQAYIKKGIESNRLGHKRKNICSY